MRQPSDNLSRVLNFIKGWLGEKMTTWGMWLGLDEAVYHKIDNVIIPAHDGTTQIDHILVSVFGIFVVETKNFKGWIFGSPDDDNWTQALFGQRYPFKNPLRQNYRHTKCLAEHLHLDHGNFHSVVFFIGECELKTPMPSNVMTAGLSSFIKSHQDRCLTDEQVQGITGALRSLKATSTITKSDHLNSLRSRHESQTKCPRCGGASLSGQPRLGNLRGRNSWDVERIPAANISEISKPDRADLLRTPLRVGNLTTLTATHHRPLVAVRWWERSQETLAPHEPPSSQR